MWNSGLEAVHLAGISFTDGIVFSFGPSAFLEPGARLVLVENRRAFEALHGLGRPVAGEYSGSLDNAGEGLTLTGPDGPDADTAPDLLLSFVYDDAAPWPAAADGGGHSLTRIEGTRDPDSPLSWRISLGANGTPGDSDTQRFTGDPHADLDANRRPDFLDYALPDGRLELRSTTDFLELVFGRNLAADDAVCLIEFSDDLRDWNELDAGAELAPGLLLPDNLWRETWRLQTDSPASRYYRIRVNRR